MWSVENDDSEDMAPKEEIVLDQLTFVKFVNFSGTWCQLRLLSFFLDKSISWCWSRRKGREL